MFALTCRPARRAVERHEDHSEGVERGHENADQYTPVGIRGAPTIRLVHGLYDEIFGVEARQEGSTDQRQRTDPTRDCRDGHHLSETAHLAHVLFVVHADDHRTGSQEQQRFEERMRHQVEDRRAISRGAERHGHVAELRERGIRHDALDVVVDDTEEAHEERGRGADDEHERERDLTLLEQRREARHHEDAGGHHRRGVNERRNRCRAFHRIWQPDVQRHLR